MWRGSTGYECGTRSTGSTALHCLSVLQGFSGQLDCHCTSVPPDRVRKWFSSVGESKCVDPLHHIMLVDFYLRLYWQEQDKNQSRLSTTGTNQSRTKTLTWWWQEEEKERTVTITSGRECWSKGFEKEKLQCPMFAFNIPVGLVLDWESFCLCPRADAKSCQAFSLPFKTNTRKFSAYTVLYLSLLRYGKRLAHVGPTDMWEWQRTGPHADDIFLEPSRQNSVQARCKMRSQYCTRMEWYCHEEWQGMEWQCPGQKECKSIVGWFVTRDRNQLVKQWKRIGSNGSLFVDNCENDHQVSALPLWDLGARSRVLEVPLGGYRDSKAVNGTDAY
jgi:hypothetical protein